MSSKPYSQTDGPVQSFIKWPRKLANELWKHGLCPEHDVRSWIMHISHSWANPTLHPYPTLLCVSSDLFRRRLGSTHVYPRCRQIHESRVMKSTLLCCLVKFVVSEEVGLLAGTEIPCLYKKWKKFIPSERIYAHIISHTHARTRTRTHTHTHAHTHTLRVFYTSTAYSTFYLSTVLFILPVICK